MTDVGPETFDLLTVPEVAVRLRVKLGALVRITPESVAAYKKRLVEAAGQAKAS